MIEEAISEENPIAPSRPVKTDQNRWAFCDAKVVEKMIQNFHTYAPSEPLPSDNDISEESDLDTYQPTVPRDINTSSNEKPGDLISPLADPLSGTDNTVVASSSKPAANSSPAVSVPGGSAVVPSASTAESTHSKKRKRHRQIFEFQTLVEKSNEELSRKKRQRMIVYAVKELGI